MISNFITRIKNNIFWNKLFKNMFSAAAGEAGSAVLSVVTTILMIKILGDTNYSTFVLAQTYMCIVDGIINFQSWAAVIKFGSERMAENDKDGLQSIIKLGTIVDMITAIAGMVLALFAAPIIGWILGWNDQFIMCSQLFAIEIVFHFSGTSVGVLRLLDYFNLVAIQKIIVAGLKCIISILLLILGKRDLIFFVFVYVIADIIGHIVLSLMSLFVIRANSDVSMRGILHASTHCYSKRFWTFAFWSNLATSIDIPVKQFDVFIMSAISYEMVAVYKVYKQIGNILVELSVPISQSIMPQFSDLVARGKTKECFSVMMKLHKTIIAAMLPCTLLITVISPKALQALFGNMYAHYFYILSIYLLIRSYALSYTSIHQLFTSMGMVKEDFFITGISNLAYVLIAFSLSKVIGILGIVVALGVQIFMSINIKKYRIHCIIETAV